MIYTVIENLTRDGRDRSLDYKLSDFFIAKGSWEARVLDAIAPGDDEIVIPKTSSSVFNSTNIDYLLRNIGVEDLVVTGFLTDQCIDHTVKDAADRGYYVTCLADACMANTQARHEAALAMFRRLLPDDDDGGMAAARGRRSIAQRVALALLGLAQLRHHFDLARACGGDRRRDRSAPNQSLRLRRRLQRVERLAERLRQLAEAGRLALGLRHRRHLQRLRQSELLADAVDAGVDQRAEREIGARRRVGRAELDVELARRIGAGQVEHRADAQASPRGRGRRCRPRSAPSGSG